MSELWVVSVVALWIVVLILAFLLAGALRELGILHLRIGDDPGALITDAGLDRGSVAPEFEGPDARTGSAIPLVGDPRSPRLIMFLSPQCLACRQVLPHVNEVVRTRPDVEVIVSCHGDPRSCYELANGYDLKAPMLVDETGEIEAAYDVRLTPFSYLLTPDRRVLMRGVANDWRQIESLLNQQGTREEGREWTAVASETAST